MFSEGENVNSFAIVETGGTQYRVHEGDTIRVESIEGDEGDTVTLKSVTLVLMVTFYRNNQGILEA